MSSLEETFDRFYEIEDQQTAEPPEPVEPAKPPEPMFFLMKEK